MREWKCSGNTDSWPQLCFPFKITPVLASFLGKHLGLAWLSTFSTAGLVLPPVSWRGDRAPSTWRRDLGLRTVWALVPIKMQTWDIPWTPPSKSSGNYFLPPCNEEAHLPISPITQGGGCGCGDAHYCCSACQGLAWRPSREAHAWTLLSGTKMVWLF